MSIYIKGMKMPKSKPICIVIDAAGQARRYDLNNDRYADDKLFEAISVPSHGRLKDYDRVMDQYSKWFHNTENREYENMFYMLQNELRSAPIILPAEEGE
ncbi:MAG: hypothetical protein IKR04_04990 [Clostridia bacterium]|nr:hypothetical protein [Clostridia bacterium]